MISHDSHPTLPSNRSILQQEPGPLNRKPAQGALLLSKPETHNTKLDNTRTLHKSILPLNMQHLQTGTDKAPHIVSMIVSHVNTSGAEIVNMKSPKHMHPEQGEHSTCKFPSCLIFSNSDKLINTAGAARANALRCAAMHLRGRNNANAISLTLMRIIHIVNSRNSYNY